MPKNPRNTRKLGDEQFGNGNPPTCNVKAVLLTAVHKRELKQARIDSYRAARDFDGYDVNPSYGYEDQTLRPRGQPGNVNPVFSSADYVSREEFTKWQQPRQQPLRDTSAPSLVLSTSTLLPIPVDTGRSQTQSGYSGHTASPDIPPLQICANVHAKQIGVFGWGPSSGPAGCKLLVFIRHTSLLAVKLLSLLHSAEDVETRFWIDFDGTKVPAVPHKYYFHENEHALEEVNAEGLGRDREVLLALVPRSVRRRVPVWLYVVGDRGRQEHNVQLGYFEYDDNGKKRF